MSGETLEGVDRSKCPSTQFHDQILVQIAQTLGTVIMFCNFRGECKRTPNGQNCMDPTPEEAIDIVEVIITFARLADAMRGAVVLQFCGGKKASKVILPKLKKIRNSHCGHENARATWNGDGPGPQRPIVRKRTRTDHGRAPFGEGAKARAREAVLLGGQGTNKKEQDQGRRIHRRRKEATREKSPRGRLAQDGICG